MTHPPAATLEVFLGNDRSPSNLQAFGKGQSVNLAPPYIDDQTLSTGNSLSHGKRLAISP